MIPATPVVMSPREWDRLVEAYRRIQNKVVYYGASANLTSMEQLVLDIFGDDCWKKANEPSKGYFEGLSRLIKTR